MEKFQTKGVVEIPKLALKAVRLQHKDTKLNHLHVQRPDRNSVFSLAFKTSAPDHTGVPHILEHTTLCGSEKFPVRDPFFKMQTRSLANYMNALTGMDYTYYPFATTNKKDFANLQQVYMDSVFSPLLREQDFLQEGWRLENEDPADPASPLVFKGVVYNEMKGQMSMPAYYFYITYLMAIYPELQYSAGDPNAIPDLSYQALKKFHQEHYHPDNCFTFSYGDFGPEEAVAQLAGYLDTVQPGKDTTSCVSREPPQPLPLTKTVTAVAKGPVDPMYDENKQHKISLTWYVGSPQDATHTLAWRVLGMLLTDGHASPFYQELVDSGIGPEFSVNTGVDETPGKLMFTIGLQGISEDKIPLFKETVFKTLDKLVADGFAQQRVDAILHQAELSDREIDANFGMNLLGRVVQRAFHPNDDMMDTLDNDALITKFKNTLAENPNFFQSELASMRDSPYFEFEMQPDPNFETSIKNKEDSLLAGRVDKLTAEDRDTLFEQGKALTAAQQEAQDVDILPTVHASDISTQAPKYPVQRTEINQVPLLVRETPTQGLSYVSLLKDLTALQPELIPFLPIYADALNNVGTTKHTMAELEDLIKLNTGGVSAGASSKHRFGHPLGLELAVGGSSLDTKLDKLYELIHELSTEVKLGNVSKIKSLLDANAGNIINSLSQSGHRYAVNQATASVSPRKALDEQLGGLTHVRLLKQLAGLSESDLATTLVPKLEAIHAMPWNTQVGITCSPGVLADHKPKLGQLLASLDATVPTDTELSRVTLGPRKAHIPLPFQVSYVGAAVKGPGYETKESAALQILSSLLTNRHLHTEIREKGGAYGGGASFNAREGLFTMYSYRDPSPDNSLKVMQNAGKWAAEQTWTDRDVEEGKIGVFQSVDSPMSPRSEIAYALGLNLSDEQRQRRRELLLSVEPKDLNDAAAKHLSGLEGFNDAGVCVLGPAAVEWEKIEVSAQSNQEKKIVHMATINRIYAYHGPCPADVPMQSRCGCPFALCEAAM